MVPFFIPESSAQSRDVFSLAWPELVDLFGMKNINLLRRETHAVAR